MHCHHEYLDVSSTLRSNRNTTDPSDCIIPSNMLLRGVYQLRAISLPLTYHNVNSYNNVIYFTDAGGAHTCQMAPGYYSSFVSLAAEVAQVMSAAGAGTVTCSINARTNVLTVINTVPFSFTFGSNTSNSAAQLLGFAGNSATATVQTGQNTMSLNSTSCYNVMIDDTMMNVTSLNGQRCTFKIPAVFSTPSVMYYQPSQEFPISIDFQATKSLHVRILDDQYRPLTNMSLDWYMMLQKC